MGGVVYGDPKWRLSSAVCVYWTVPSVHAGFGASPWAYWLRCGMLPCENIMEVLLPLCLDYVRPLRDVVRARLVCRVWRWTLDRCQHFWAARVKAMVEAQRGSQLNVADLDALRQWFGGSISWRELTKHLHVGASEVCQLIGWGGNVCCERETARMGGRIEYAATCW